MERFLLFIHTIKGDSEGAVLTYEFYSDHTYTRDDRGYLSEYRVNNETKTFYYKHPHESWDTWGNGAKIIIAKYNEAVAELHLLGKEIGTQEN